MPEEAEPDRHRECGGREPDPEIGVGTGELLVGSGTVDSRRRRPLAVAPGARQRPDDRQVAGDERERHDQEQAEHVHGRGSEPEVRAVAEQRPEEQLARSDEERHDRDRDREPGRGLTDPPLPAGAPHQVDHGQERGGAGLLGQRRNRDRHPGCTGLAARAEEHRRGHRRQHEDLEVRGLSVLRRERDRGQDEQDPGEPGRALAVAAARLQREQQPGERDREHRDDAHRPQRGRPEHAERRRVEVRHEGRLPVGRVLVEPATLVDHLGLGGEERLVGVEDLDEERRESQRARQQQEDRQDLPRLRPACGSRPGTSTRGRVDVGPPVREGGTVGPVFVEREIDGHRRAFGRRSPIVPRTTHLPGIR